MFWESFTFWLRASTETLPKVHFKLIGLFFFSFLSGTSHLGLLASETSGSLLLPTLFISLCVLLLASRIWILQTRRHHLHPNNGVSAVRRLTWGGSDLLKDPWWYTWAQSAVTSTNICGFTFLLLTLFWQLPTTSAPWYTLCTKLFFVFHWHVKLGNYDEAGEHCNAVREL